MFHNFIFFLNLCITTYLLTATNITIGPTHVCQRSFIYLILLMLMMGSLKGMNAPSTVKPIMTLGASAVSDANRLNHKLLVKRNGSFWVGTEGFFCSQVAGRLRKRVLSHKAVQQRQKQNNYLSRLLSGQPRNPQMIALDVLKTTWNTACR